MLNSKPYLVLLFLAACSPDLDLPQFDADRHAWPYYEPALVAGRAPHARPIAGPELEQRLAEVLDGDAPPALGLDAPSLRAAIVDALGTGFLLDGLADRPFTVREVEQIDLGEVVWRRLVIADEVTVDLAVDLLEPRGHAGDHPAVVALHGHYDDGVVMLERYLGSELAARGVTVVAPHFRHMDCGDDEREQALLLLRDGFTLMGYRVHEALLAVKLARALDGVDPARIGIIAHSGGSSTTNLMVRLVDDLAAVVTDWEVEYRNTCTGEIHCETVPALVALAGDINDQRTLTVPHLRVDYGYQDEAQRAAVVDFFAATLGAAGR